jgi:hypothetical protein
VSGPRRLHARGSPLGLRLESVERAPNGPLPLSRDDRAPAAPKRPEVGTELAAVLEVCALVRLAERELLDDVGHGTAHEPEVNSPRRLEANGLQRRRDERADRGVVLREDRVRSPFEDA